MKMKIIIVGVVMALLSGCTSHTQHVGTIPEQVTVEEGRSLESYTKTDFAQIICAKGEGDLLTKTPKLQIRFDDEGLGRNLVNLFGAGYYEAVKIAPGKRNFTLRFLGGGTATFRIKGFLFKPNTTYYAYYSKYNDRIKVWIETDKEEIVYGYKPKEGEAI